MAQTRRSERLLVATTMISITVGPWVFLLWLDPSAVVDVLRAQAVLLVAAVPMLRVLSRDDHQLAVPPDEAGCEGPAGE
jgi:hypothetical protein